MSSASPDSIYYEDDHHPIVESFRAGRVGPSLFRVALTLSDASFIFELDHPPINVNAGEIDTSSLSLDLIRLRRDQDTILPTAMNVWPQVSVWQQVVEYTFNLPSNSPNEWLMEIMPGVLRDKAQNTQTAVSGVAIVGIWDESYVTPPAPAPSIINASLIPLPPGLYRPLLLGGNGEHLVLRGSGVDTDTILQYRDGLLLAQIDANDQAGFSVETIQVTDSGSVAFSNRSTIAVAANLGAPAQLIVDVASLGLGSEASVFGITMSSDGTGVAFAVATGISYGAGLYLSLRDPDSGEWHAPYQLVSHAYDDVLSDTEIFYDRDANGILTPGNAEDWQPNLPVDAPRISARDSEGNFTIIYDGYSGVVSIECRIEQGQLAANTPQRLAYYGTSGVFFGAEEEGSADTLYDGDARIILMDQSFAASSAPGVRQRLGIFVFDWQSDDNVYPIHAFGSGVVAVFEDLGRRPVLVLPGIFGSLPQIDRVSDWLVNRGVHPNQLQLDPIQRTYADMIRTLENAGFVNGRDLFAAAYDWRLPPAPVHEVNADIAGPWTRTIDGIITLSNSDLHSLGPNPTFHHGIDYLAWWMNQAKRAWEQAHPGRTLRSVDVIGHSTGGIITRAFVQSTLYGTRSDLPTINTFISMAVPHRGASKAWSLLHDNLAAEPAYQYFVGGLVWAAYRKVMNDGLSVNGPSPALRITRQTVLDARAHFPSLYRTDEEAFISLYVPTGRALLATYAFLGSYDGGAPQIRSVNNPGDPYFDQRNTLLLDLNNGLDLGTAGRDSDPHYVRRIASGRPDAVGNLVSRVAVRAFYTTDQTDTAVFAEEHIGPGNRQSPGESGSIFSFNEDNRGFPTRFPDSPIEGEVWWLDSYRFSAGSVRIEGDGTVGSISAGDIFLSHPSVRVHHLNGRDLDHGSVNSDVQTQVLVLRELGIAAFSSEIHTGLYQDWFIEYIPEANEYNNAFTADPVGAIITDGLGRRTGWSPSTGVLEEIPGSLVWGHADAAVLLPADLVGPLRITLTGVVDRYAVKLTISGSDGRPLTYAFDGAIGVGQTIQLPPIRVDGEPDYAAAFIATYHQGVDPHVGLVRGDWITQRLDEFLDDVAFAQGYWGGTNYWFQDSSGDVWSLWHGGPVHADPANPGQHFWVLTNLVQEAGLSGQVRFAPGSITGISTGWNAFNINGIINGRLQALWWSPQGSAGQWLDANGVWRQGLGLGLRQNGWVLSSVSDVMIDLRTNQTAMLPELRPYTYSRGSGRTTFDPRAMGPTFNDGMSIVVVDVMEHVYVASFTPVQANIPGSRPEYNGVWVLEPLRDLPSLAWFGLLGLIGEFERTHIEASR